MGQVITCLYLIWKVQGKMSLEKWQWKKYWKSNSTVCLLHRVPTHIFLECSIFTSFPSFKSFHHLPHSYFLYCVYQIPILTSSLCTLFIQECCQWRTSIPSVVSCIRTQLNLMMAKRIKNAGYQTEPSHIVKPAIMNPLLVLQELTWPHIGGHPQ